MKNTLFIGATELAETLEISRAQSYKIIQKMNSELERNGYMTLTGKVSRAYFLETIFIFLMESSLKMHLKLKQ